MTHDLAGTVNDQVLGFGYNPASQIVQRTRSNSGWEYTEQVQGTKAYAVNGLNQYTSAAGVAFAYDANGNLSFDGTNTYKYDAENRLVSVTGGTGVTLSYDPMGRLWQYAAPSGSGTVRFLYDGDQLTEEENTSGALLRALRAWAWTRTILWPGMNIPAVRCVATSMPTTRARSWQWQTMPATRSRSTNMTNGAFRRRAMRRLGLLPSGSNIPAKCGFLISVSIITRPESTRAGLADSCRQIQ